MREMLKGELCTPCKDILFSKEERQWILEQLRMENAQLHEKYEELILGKTGILVSKVPSLSPAPGSSLDAATGSLLGQRIGGLSLDHDLGSRKFIPSTLLYQLKEEQESEKLQMFQTVVNAIDELTSLMITETLWIKDPTDGRYIIHRDNYEKTFPRISHLKGSRARFESSKAEGIVRMKGTELVGMLMNSTKRPDLFPTISTKAMTIRELGTQSGSLSGSLQLVYEQMHVLSPLVAPREFFCLHYCEQINEVEWIIVEVSYDCFNESQQTSPFRSWRLPSGCFVKDLPNGCSKITWVEHVQVNDKALTHRICRDFVFRGLAYGAERWLLSLQRMGERFACEMVGNATGQDLGGGTLIFLYFSFAFPVPIYLFYFYLLPSCGCFTILFVSVIIVREGKRSIMDLTHRMVKNLCASLTMKRKLDIPQLSELNSSGIRVSMFNSMGQGQPQGLIVNATISLWLPHPYQVVFDFLRDEKLRYQWDSMFKGNQSQQIASIAYGYHPGNCISILKPLIACENNNTLVLQESCIDPLGAIITYAPITIKCLDMALSGADSSTIPILPSGFIISGDGHPDTRARASSSTTRPIAGGSLLTVVYQIPTRNASSSRQVDIELVASIKELVSSTVQDIWSALHCGGID
ncbi:homeobox-leucine zipper protein HDG11-like isoform X1 [Actinidia eriantha]|uniref:homeobox-leucine zipper protein HDG11-like isoform X1 n=1 Tax=Actinidia eriantha TaxID=165200 RepID=UPI002590023B|nr:homeobox-leucine zipper protein HDG11-like isoform X1 [Actinidia eriantha]XP_057465532.1 homeobox-leucine zipper protein HDG11-like isoform X1 [Actinidia eriantha]XP_057465533.1 homeobox-leucine zipper protein HDG11-like isoform X1 [Actinidia eriantha]XP_057465534.1 homeobox-leucine zipper protein HDG11-like isoform X1 [Actinidia eriantha]XP_057465535.1 homeobox-leucine zipper protein HDG11-like isoform X1 [Actinidia eriantha]XP_057465536.1 homeobox-leucine zipper protein HDG11-like isoform